MPQMNTDVQALHHNSAESKLHIGKTVTRGLGAGMDPEMGKRSAEESRNEIRESLKDSNMVFITCGLCCGTGSGASPVIAEIAREVGALTVAVVTKPFGFEGPQRKAISDRAYEELARKVDTIITIPNDRVLQIIDKKTSLLEAFKIVDDVLRQGVQGISELITTPGLINVDFADVKAIMEGQGSALMGIGHGTGENRAIDAAKSAISSPLLDLSIDGARGVLFLVSGGPSLTMHEVSEAAKAVTGSVNANAKIIFGAVIDEMVKDEVRITVIATGFAEKSRPLMAAKTAFASSSYTPSPFFKTKEREADSSKAEQSQPLGERPFTTRTIPAGDVSAERPARMAANVPASDEEDLEIPAFIRKKML